jgi:hypothetical protein
MVSWPAAKIKKASESLWQPLLGILDKVTPERSIRCVFLFARGGLPGLPVTLVSCPPPPAALAMGNAIVFGEYLRVSVS